MTNHDDQLPTGELPELETEERREFRELSSGVLFKYDLQGEEAAYSYTSHDGGRTWDRGGELMTYRGPIQGLDNASIQLKSATYRGRIVLPFYLYMHGLHPDYTNHERGGYATYKNKTLLLETHTHVPEMSGSFMVWSDDEGQSWSTSKGFLLGYFDDGHMGFTTTDEPVVVELSDGQLMCYMRSTCGRIVKSYSADGGESWTKVEPTELAMSNSPCALSHIPHTDDLVLIWNQVSAEEIETGFRRGRLSMAISKNDGQTWENHKTLELVSGLSTGVLIKPPPLTSMVRGPSGPDNLLGQIPDDFRYYGYPEIYFHDEQMLVCYKAHSPEGPLPRKWRTFSIQDLYNPDDRQCDAR